MPDARDDSAEPPCRKPPSQSFDASLDEDAGDNPSTHRDVPKRIRIAGLIWITFGGLILVSCVIYLAIWLGLPIGPTGIDPWVGSVVETPFGIVFLIVGVRSLRGRTTHTLRNGAASFFVGCLDAAAGALTLWVSVTFGPATIDDYILGASFLFYGAVMILAGSLALMGRADYKAYRRAVERATGDDD